MQTGERLGAVGEGGPVADALREAGDRVVGHLEAEVGRDAAEARREHLPVGAVRRPLGLRLVPCIGLEQRVVTDLVCAG